MTSKKKSYKIAKAAGLAKKQFACLFQRPSCKRQNSIRLVKRYTRLIK